MKSNKSYKFKLFCINEWMKVANLKHQLYNTIASGLKVIN